MFKIPDNVARPTNRSNFPSAATAAVITIAADAAQLHVLKHMTASFSAIAAVETLTIAIDGTTVWEVDISTVGPHFFDLSGWSQAGGFYDADGLNKEMVITLSADAAGTGKLNATTY